MPIDPAFLRPAGALEGPLFDGFVRRISAGTREYAPGERIGPFAVVREIGRGGMAVVYLGRRAHGEFVQQVALKLVRADALDGVAEELFRHERQVLAHLAHPHIGRLLDGGRTPECALWFAMEYIEGDPSTPGARAADCRCRRASTCSSTSARRCSSRMRGS